MPTKKSSRARGGRRKTTSKESEQLTRYEIFIKTSTPHATHNLTHSTKSVLECSRQNVRHRSTHNTAQSAICTKFVSIPWKLIMKKNEYTHTKWDGGGEENDSLRWKFFTAKHFFLCCRKKALIKFFHTALTPLWVWVAARVRVEK